MTSDHASIRIKSDDIDRVEKPREASYSESGVDPDDQKKLAIKETPFDLDQDK